MFRRHAQSLILPRAISTHQTPARILANDFASAPLDGTPRVTHSTQHARLRLRLHYRILGTTFAGPLRRQITPRFRLATDWLPAAATTQTHSHRIVVRRTAAVVDRDHLAVPLLFTTASRATTYADPRLALLHRHLFSASGMRPARTLPPLTWTAVTTARRACCVPLSGGLAERALLTHFL